MEQPISAERLSALVGLIYDCAIDPSRWPIAMEAIRVELGFHNATLNLQKLPSGELLSNVTCNIAPDYRAMMAGAGPDVIEQWGGEERVATVPLDRPAVLTRVNPSFDFATTTNHYYLAFAKPQGIIDVLAIGLARDPLAIGTISFGRHQSAGPIGEREIGVAQLLVPHLQRAATINRMLDHAVAARTSFEMTFDALAVPIVLVGAKSEIIHANPAARRVLAQGKVIRSVDGVLTATTSGASSALAVSIAHAACDESGIGRRGLGIPVSGPHAVLAALHVLPLRPTRTATDTGAVAAIFVAQVDTPFVAPTEVVSALFDLTPAEMRVFDQLVTGQTIAKTAVALGIERSTVKTHLLRLYDKIGVRRQADLVQIAASLTLPILGK